MIIPKEIPLLTAREVELRVGSMGKDNKSCSLLVYKDARVDMRILDEVFGRFGWERTHQIIDGQLFCTVRVLDPATGCWVSKQDVGTESRTEAEKGRASDAFKRACFNIGIGRELYDAPDIRVSLDPKEIYNGKLSAFVKFHVKEMEYSRELGEYTKFVVVDNNGKVRFSLNSETAPKKKDETKPPKPAETSPDKQKQGQELTKGAGPSGNTQKPIKDVVDQLGGSVVNLEAVVRKYNGKTQIYIKDAWRTLAVMDKEQLEYVLTIPAFKEAHNEARYHLNKLGQK